MRDDDVHKKLLSAANAFSNEHGHEALRAILRATAGVDRIVDVPESDYATVLMALAEGKVKAFAKQQQPSPRSVSELDHAAIWNRWNRGYARREA